MDAGERRAAISLCLTIYAVEFRKHWLSLCVFIAILICNSMLSITGPYVFSTLVGDLPKEILPWVIGFGFYAFTTAMIQALHRVIYSLSLTHAERLEFSANTRFFAALVHKNADFFTRYNPAEIQSAQSSGGNAISASFFMVFSYLLPAFLNVGLSVWLMAMAIDLSIVMIVIIYGAVYVCLCLLAMEKTNSYLNDAIKAGQENAAFVGNAVSMIEPIRHAGSAAWMQQRFIDKAAGIVQNWRAFAQRQMMFGAITGLALFAQLVIAFSLLYPKYQSGSLGVGDIVLFNMLLLQLNYPFEAIGQGLSEFQRSLSKLLPYIKILREPNEADAEADLRRSVSGSIDVIKFENVTYRYQNGRGVCDVSLEARRGVMTFITGETGAGKSTLFRLLQKNIEPQQGAIFIGQSKLSDVTKADWLPRIGIVPQEIQMLNDTLGTNIVLGRELDDERLLRAVQRAAILERVQSMPDGFDTMIGERGLKLSGGERQRIAIARALYHEPDILLLDEASSALDEDTERAIMDQLRSVDADMIIIAITHRRASLREGDMVVELQAS